MKYQYVKTEIEEKKNLAVENFVNENREIATNCSEYWSLQVEAVFLPF